MTLTSRQPAQLVLYHVRDLQAALARKMHGGRRCLHRVPSRLAHNPRTLLASQAVMQALQQTAHAHAISLLNAQDQAPHALPRVHVFEQRTCNVSRAALPHLHKCRVCSPENVQDRAFELIAQRAAHVRPRPNLMQKHADQVASPSVLTQDQRLQQMPTTRFCTPRLPGRGLLTPARLSISCGMRGVALVQSELHGLLSHALHVLPHVWYFSCLWYLQTYFYLPRHLPTSFLARLSELVSFYALFKHVCPTN